MMENTPLIKHKRLKDTIVIVFVVIQLVLGFKALLTSEKYFGWGMFSNVFYLRTRVYGFTQKGDREQISKWHYRDWVRGRAFGHVRARKHFALYLWGKGLLEREYQRFGEQLCQRPLTKHYKKIEIVYRTMPISKDETQSKLHKKTFQCDEYSN